MQSKRISIRNRLVLIIAVFFTVYLLLALYTDKAARDTVNHSQTLSVEMQEVGFAVSKITNTLHLLGIGMYQSTLFDEEDQPEIIQIQLETLAKQIGELINLNVVINTPEFYDPALKLSENLKLLSIHAQKMLEISGDYQIKYPAMPIMLNNLRPINREMMGLIISSIDEARHQLDHNPDQERVMDLFRDLRYVWAQLVSSVRVFVANRLGAFGPPQKTMSIIQRDRLLYSEVVTDLQNQLDVLSKQGLLGLVQEHALEKMKRLHVEYQVYFAEASKIYLSDRWRADKTLLRDQLDPALDVAWSQIFLITNRINAHARLAMGRYASTADKMSNFIWLAASIAMALLIITFFTFEYLIRKPIIQIAGALQAEGEGKSYIPKLKFNVKETNVLIKAFAAMRAQVRSRQLRLQTILDNAGEGILTVDINGRIQSFNKAAEILFGYSEEEAVGKNMSLIMPEYGVITNQQQILLLKRINNDNDKETVLPDEQDVVGQHQTGRKFPMSLRLGQVVIEGETLYTALVSDISERKLMIDRLTQLAERDSLTGLYNRHFLMDELERIIDRSNRGEKLSLSLLYIDLDNFKYVNDTLGHIAGDTVLKEVTMILEKRARGTDLITRLGGDEFAILLYDVDDMQAKATASAYRQQLADYVFRYEGKIVDVGCSIGVINMSEHVQKKEELLSKADLACHIAKRAGRNRVHVYSARDQGDIDTMSSAMGWSRRIKHAMEHNGFYQYTQSIVEVSTGRVLSNEVLLRLKDKRGDLIMPSGFLPSAERFGLSVDLDRWVIKNSFKMLGAQKSRQFAGYSINLSATTISDETVLQFIEEQMHQFRINPSVVIFEVTETSAIENLDQAVVFLTHLQKLGFKTALDDFGTGYSSFTYLKDLPVDYVKLDGSFIQSMADDKVKIAIVVAMNDVVHALGKQTIAEFVEDNNTLNLLKEIGVDYCQGFYTGKPVSILDKPSNVVSMIG